MGACYNSVAMQRGPVITMLLCSGACYNGVAMQWGPVIMMLLCNGGLL